MHADPIPLSVLDLVPIASGSNVAEAVHRTVDLARRAERGGYHRYWLAEHHLNPGVAGSAPALLMGLVAAATSTIRVGSGAVQMGHQTPLSVVEQFGLLDALHPGRIDLGLGRSGARRQREPGPSAAVERPLAHTAPPARLAVGGRSAPTTANGAGGNRAEARVAEERTTERGLVIPRRFSFAHLLRSPRFALQAKLLQQPGAQTPAYAEQIDDILRLLAGTYGDGDTVVRAIPGEQAGFTVWIMGSSGGESAAVAGARGLPFGANYHVSPATVLEAVTAYRSAFRPSDVLPEPRVLVSADVVVGPDERTARTLAAGYPLWVRSIRLGLGAIAFPTPQEAADHVWSEADRELVADRVATQFVGNPAQVADRLEVLAAETGADELMVTTITHGHEDRARSFDLLAQEWRRRGHLGAIGAGPPL